jgi:tripartite-type tricarboxylate transporter receptor subunit TctC
MTTRRSLGALAAASLAAAALPRAAHAAWPERPVNLVVPWAAGGGTDAIARIIAKQLQDIHGRPFNVVNRPGAGGVLGHTEIANANPDGYTIGLATAELTTYRALGTGQIGADSVTPIALVNFDAAAFNVRADSPWQDLKQALDAIRANPGRFKISGFPAGAAYHIAFGALLQQVGIPVASVPLVPGQGAAPGFQELAAGGIDITASSVPEGTAMRDAGRVRTLAVFSAARLPAFPSIPTVKEAIGVDFAGGTWRGIAGPKAMNAEAAARLTDSVEKIYNSEEYRKFMADRGFGLQWAKGPDFAAFLAAQETRNAETLKALGLAR